MFELAANFEGFGHKVLKFPLCSTQCIMSDIHWTICLLLLWIKWSLISYYWWQIIAFVLSGWVIICFTKRIWRGNIPPTAIHQIHWYCLFQMDLSWIWLGFASRCRCRKLAITLTDLHEKLSFWARMPYFHHAAELWLCCKRWKLTGMHLSSFIVKIKNLDAICKL